MVHELLIERGFTLSVENTKRCLCKSIDAVFSGSSRNHLVYKLLYGLDLGFWSCERLKVLLSEKLKDKQLARFYKKMMISEANHHTMFLQFARTYGGREQTDQKWKALLEFEELINFGKKELPWVTLLAII